MFLNKKNREENVKTLPGLNPKENLTNERTRLNNSRSNLRHNRHGNRNFINFFNSIIHIYKRKKKIMSTIVIKEESRLRKTELHPNVSWNAIVSMGLEFFESIGKPDQVKAYENFMAKKYPDKSNEKISDLASGKLSEMLETAENPVPAGYQLVMEWDEEKQCEIPTYVKISE
jgi:hypothetical protein